MQRVALALILAAACRPAPQKPGSPAFVGKAQAPVRIEATVGGAQATLALTFDAPATDVTVRVVGIDGLMVRPMGDMIQGQSFAPGSTAQLQVEFNEPVGVLSVWVRGQFNGVLQAKTAAFRLGSSHVLTTPDLPQGPDGRPMVVLPSRQAER